MYIYSVIKNLKFEMSERTLLSVDRSMLIDDQDIAVEVLANVQFYLLERMKSI